MKRDEVSKNWQNWRDQMAYDKSHPTVTSDQTDSKRDKAYREVIGHIENDLMVKGQEKASIKKKDSKLDRTIAEEIQTNVCPICLELMIPPKNKPFILFPCGHTFCAECIVKSEAATGNKKCAVCKRVYTQKAINHSLQNLICIFTNNRHLLEAENSKTSKESEQESEDKLFYESKLQSLSSRITLLTASQSESEARVYTLKESLSSLEQAEKLMLRELVDCKDKYELAQKELHIAEVQYNKFKDDREKVKEEHSEEEEKLKVIKETIGGLKQERIKVSLILNELT